MKFPQIPGPNNRASPTSLDLKMNKIGDEGTQELSALTNLVTLHAGYNQIGDDGARTLSTLTNLTSLTVWNNKITGEIKSMLRIKLPNTKIYFE